MWTVIDTTWIEYYGGIKLDFSNLFKFQNKKETDGFNFEDC